MSNLDLKSPIIPTTPEQVSEDTNGLSVVLDTSASAAGADRGMELDVKDHDEEMKLEALPSKANQTTQTPERTTRCWPKRVCKGLPRLASSMEDVVGLSEFCTAVTSCNRMQSDATGHT